MPRWPQLFHRPPTTLTTRILRRRCSCRPPLTAPRLIHHHLWLPCLNPQSPHRLSATRIRQYPRTRISRRRLRRDTHWNFLAEQLLTIPVHWWVQATVPMHPRTRTNIAWMRWTLTTRIWPGIAITEPPPRMVVSMWRGLRLLETTRLVQGCRPTL